MEITREMIVARIADLRAKRDEMAANVNAFTGAIEMNEEWLAVLEIAQLPVEPEQEDEA